MMGFSHVLRNGIHHCLSIHWSVCSGSKGVDNLCFHTYGEFFPYSSPPHPPPPSPSKRTAQSDNFFRFYGHLQFLRTIVLNYFETIVLKNLKKLLVLLNGQWGLTRPFSIFFSSAPPSPKSPGPYLSLEGWYVWYNEEQVAQGQYVVSDTRCPPLSDCELEWGGAGQLPQRGQSPVEHRGTFVRPAWRSEWDAIEGWLKAFKSLNWGLRKPM